MNSPVFPVSFNVVKSFVTLLTMYRFSLRMHNFEVIFQTYFGTKSVVTKLTFM